MRYIILGLVLRILKTDRNTELELVLFTKLLGFKYLIREITFYEYML